MYFINLAPGVMNIRGCFVLVLQMSIQVFIILLLITDNPDVIVSLKLFMNEKTL